MATSPTSWDALVQIVVRVCYERFPASFPGGVLMGRVRSPERIVLELDGVLRVVLHPRYPVVGATVHIVDVMTCGRWDLAVWRTEHSRQVACSPPRDPGLQSPVARALIRRLERELSAPDD